MKRGIELVEKFHEVFKHDVNKIPAVLNEEGSHLRYELMKEENEEYIDACNQQDIEKIADALGDQMYILFGSIVAHGMQDIIEEVFLEIHRSNMSKLDKSGNPIINGENGITDPDKPLGKILKGDGYTPPNIAGILDKYFQDMLAEKLMDAELKDHIDDTVELRETFLRAIIEKNLSKSDWKKFQKFEELADYFKDKVRLIQERASFDFTKFGVDVNGEVHWYKEKQESEY